MRMASCLQFSLTTTSLEVVWWILWRRSSQQTWSLLFKKTYSSLCQPQKKSKIFYTQLYLYLYEQLQTRWKRKASKIKGRPQPLVTPQPKIPKLQGNINPILFPQFKDDQRYEVSQHLKKCKFPNNSHWRTAWQQKRILIDPQIWPENKGMPNSQLCESYWSVVHQEINQWQTSLLHSLFIYQ